MATELAMHCERGRDYSRNVQYRRHASEHAIQRSNHEAMIHLTKGRELSSRGRILPSAYRKNCSYKRRCGCCNEGGAAVALTLDTLTRSA
jgi:hypothetical protein